MTDSMGAVMAESDADTLRRAAALMRERWYGRPPTPPEAFILALADWLDKEADHAAFVEFGRVVYSSVPHALAVARAYLEQP